jgi:hypothetical protein
VAAAGAAVAGTAVAVSGGEDTPTTLSSAATTTTTTPVATSATTTTTLLPKAANHPPFAVLKTSPDPPEGLSPLTVTFDLCKSTDPDGDPLSFFFEFGDGAKASGSCVETHTYTASALRDLRAFDRSYGMEACVVDPSGASHCRSRNVVAQLPPPPTTPTTTVPSAPCVTTIRINSPTSGQCFTGMSIPVSATAKNTSKVTFFADFTGAACASPPVNVASQAVIGPGPTYSTTLDVTVPGPGCYTIRANAVDGCQIFGPAVITVPATPVPSVFVDTPPGCVVPLKDTAVQWASDLALEGRLQIVHDGSVSFAGRGKTYGMSGLAGEETRVEATLVDAADKPGLWRFDLLTTSAVAAGSIRVISGDPVQISSTSVTFRLQGRAGERVVFSFDKKCRAPSRPAAPPGPGPG